MKYFASILLISGICCISYSQELKDQLSDILKKAWNDIPVDQLFVDSDRNLYHPGDTIWFEAYVRDRRSGIMETESASLYVILLDSELKTADSARFRINLPAVPGWLKVPEEALPGDYTLLAFTSNQMNYNPEYAFNVPLRIDNLVPSMKISSAKDNSENAVPGAANTILAQGMPSLNLKFLPEGGTFITGITQRLAFNVTDQTGKNIKVNGVIKNQKGEKIISFRSGLFGPGTVEFKPLAGDIYFASLDIDKYKDTKWQLPEAKLTGAALRVNTLSDEFLEIIVRGNGITSSTGLLTIMMNNSLVYSENIKIDTIFRKTFRTNKLPAGSGLVTLYDNELNPLAERLIFINPAKKMHIGISSDYDLGTPGDETKLTIRTTDQDGRDLSSVISISVIDSASGVYNGFLTPDIVSTFYYDKEFLGNLPPEIRSKGLGTLNKNDLDVILLTYGWRRFVPKEISLPDAIKEPANYDFIKIISDAKGKKAREEVNILSVEDLSTISLKPDKNGEAVLYFDSLARGINQVLILPDMDPHKNSKQIIIRFPENLAFMSDIKKLTEDKTFRLPVLQDTSASGKGLAPGDLFVIESVTIKPPASPLKKYEDKNAVTYRSGTTQTMSGRDLISTANLEDILRKYNSFYIADNNISTQGAKSKVIYLRGIEHLSGSSFDKDKKVWTANSGLVPALFVLDGNPIGESYETIASIPSSKIVSVTYLKGVQGYAMYGAKAMGGVIFVTTKMGKDNSDSSSSVNELSRNDDLMKQVRLFRQEREYYIPSKEEIRNLPEYYIRPTILWKGDLTTDDTGTIKISYLNITTHGDIIIKVNGISASNLAGSARLKYHVK